MNFGFPVGRSTHMFYYLGTLSSGLTVRMRFDSFDCVFLNIFFFKYCVGLAFSEIRSLGCLPNAKGLV